MKNSINKNLSETVLEDKLFCEFKDRNNSDSFDKLFRKLSPWLMRLILRISGDVDAAEDILQETWISIVNKKGKFNPEKGKFRYYIMTVAKNEALKWKNKEKNISEKNRIFSENRETVDLKDPSFISERREKAEGIKKALSSLKQQYQDVIILYYFDDMKVSDIAELLDKPPGTIKTWLDRGRTQLEKKLTGIIKHL